MPPINRRKLHHDLNIPFSSSSLSSKRKVQEANQYQNRLSKLGYSEIAFTHTAYGRLKLDKDDADYTLPWKDLIPESSNYNTDSTDMISSGGEHHCKKVRSIGQINKQLNIKVYRRLNIIVEEVSDVSRILLPNNDSSSSDRISELLQKYDIISLQPMNEPALQNICELMAATTSHSTPSNTSTNSNNTHYIDIIVLEYATGSRGGHGLPYKLRKDYLVKALSAGITFEVCYGTAILDPKRRQGFIRTLLDFQTTFNSIQKKHMLLKNNQQQRKCKSNKFPLVISSGSRQNYTLGTSDEGVLAIRTLEDVNCLVSTLMGGDSGSLFDMGIDDDMNDGKNQKKKQRAVMSAADRVLARASDRALGIVSTSSSQGDKKRKQRGWDTRSHIVAYDSSDEESDIFSPYSGGATSLGDWLSKPQKKVKEKEEVDCEGEETAKPNQREGTESTISPLDRSNKDESSKLFKSVDKGADTSATQEKINDSGEEEDKDDIEDGYIAL